MMTKRAIVVEIVNAAKIAIAIGLTFISQLAAAVNVEGDGE